MDLSAECVRTDGISRVRKLFVCPQLDRDIGLRLAGCRATRLRSSCSAAFGDQAFVEHAKAVTARVFHGIHGSVGIAEEFFRGAAVLRKNSDSDAEGQTDFPAADRNGLGGAANNLFAAALNVPCGLEFAHHNDELVSAHTCDGVGFANAREQALPHGREEDVTIGMAKRVVDLFKVVDVNEEDRNSLAVILRAEDRLAETLVEQRAIGEAGQVIMMCEIADVIGASTVLGNVAAGNGDTVAEPDDLNIEPGALDHLIVDEDFTGVGYPGANNLTIFMDEAGLDHEGPNFGKDFAVEGFAGHAKPTLGIRVNVTESEVDDGAGGIGDAVEDVEGATG